MPEGSAKGTAAKKALAETFAAHSEFGQWRRDVIRQALAADPVVSLDGSAAADGTVIALQSLFVELDPLLGSRALHALYGRSLYLVRSSFRQPLALPDESQHFLDPLHANLASRSLEDARQASETLLVAFSDLLITFLGEPIAQRAVRSAWGGTTMTRNQTK